MSTIENAVKKALASFSPMTVSAGPAPADADAGTVYYMTEKISISDGICTAAVKIRYFPFGTPISSDGDAVYGFIKNIMIGSRSYEAIGYVCRVYARYVDVTIEYKLDEYALYDGISDDYGYVGNTDEGGDHTESDDKNMMRTLTLRIRTEGAV